MFNSSSNLTDCHCVRTVVCAIALAACGVLVASPAHAQIYTWHDVNGHLVLSNLPRPGDTTVARTYAVPQAVSVRATRAVMPAIGAMYESLIAEHAQLNGIRADLVRAVVQVESAFNPSARSPKGAIGLMQLMPATAQRFGVRNPFNPAENVRAGALYLRQLLDRYGDDEQLALAAYNAGPGAVDRHGQSIPPYRETQDYVARINGLTTKPAAPRHVNAIYHTTEIIEGRPVQKFSNIPAASGPIEVASR